MRLRAYLSSAMRHHPFGTCTLAIGTCYGRTPVLGVLSARLAAIADASAASSSSWLPCACPLPFWALPPHGACRLAGPGASQALLDGCVTPPGRSVTLVIACPCRFSLTAMQAIGGGLSRAARETASLQTCDYASAHLLGCWVAVGHHLVERSSQVAGLPHLL